MPGRIGRSVSCPAVRFAVKTAAWDLSQGGRGVIAESPFSRGECAIDINGLVWMGPVANMLQHLEDPLHGASPPSNAKWAHMIGLKSCACSKPESVVRL